MAIEFVCSSCLSKHASAEHMAGKQFRCGGCGKILIVPTPGAEASGSQPPPAMMAPRNAEPDTDTEEREANAMGTGMQVGLMIAGGLVVVVLLLLVCGGVLLVVPRFLARQAVPAPAAPGPVIKLEAEPNPGPQPQPPR